MNAKKMMLCALGLAIAGIVQADTVFSGGSMTNAANWSAGVPNGAGDTVGIVNVSGTIPNVNQSASFFAGSTITVGGGAVITAPQDLPADNTTWIINDATLTLGDDLFCRSSSITLNAGSAVNVNDDFEAQDNFGGLITINGGSHTAGDYFGFQGHATNPRSGSVEFLGGTVTAARFRFKAQAGGGTAYMDLGGSATATATGTTAAGDIDGTVNVLSGWSGSLTAANFTGDDWKNAVVAGDWSLNGAAVDASVFDANFVVTDGGQTLAIPEPGTLGLIAVFGGGVLFIRRRFMI